MKTISNNIGRSLYVLLLALFGVSVYALAFALLGLVAGFLFSGTAQAQAPINADVWTPTGSLISGRADHTATLLSNGKVLVTGGFFFDGTTDVDLDSAELYDPVAQTWGATGRMNKARSNHTATLMFNGEVLVTGGVSTLDSTAELYDPASGTWSLTGSLNVPRANATATLLGNGKVLVAGGAGESSFIASAEIYDPATGTW
ncbi:MAG: Kelch repeat-containing protein, partial [Rudaea sp.]